MSVIIATTDLSQNNAGVTKLFAPRFDLLFDVIVVARLPSGIPIINPDHSRLAETIQLLCVSLTLRPFNAAPLRLTLL